MQPPNLLTVKKFIDIVPTYGFEWCHFFNDKCHIPPVEDDSSVAHSWADPARAASAAHPSKLSYNTVQFMSPSPKTLISVKPLASTTIFEVLKSVLLSEPVFLNV
jgi:hypothetical protein